jgi:hypothetical protein
MFTLHTKAAQEQDWSSLIGLDAFESKEIPVELPKNLFEEKDSPDSVKFDADPPSEKNYRVPFPEEYTNSKEIPGDINAFLTKMYPNMLCVARDKLRKWGLWDETEEVVQDFVRYFLSEGDNGIAVWKRYDAVTYPENNYLWWFLMHLNYFVRGYASRNYTHRHRLVSYETYFGEDSPLSLDGVDLDTGCVSPDNWSPRVVKIDEDVYSLTLLRQIESHLNMLGKTIPYSNRKFESQACNLFVSRLHGTTDAVIAENLGVSANAVSLWFVKLKKVLASFLEENQTDFDF